MATRVVGRFAFIGSPSEQAARESRTLARRLYRSPAPVIPGGATPAVAKRRRSECPPGRRARQRLRARHMPRRRSFPAGWLTSLATPITPSRLHPHRGAVAAPATVPRTRLTATMETLCQIKAVADRARGEAEELHRVASSRRRRCRVASSMLSSTADPSSTATINQRTGTTAIRSSWRHRRGGRDSCTTTACPETARRDREPLRPGAVARCHGDRHPCALGTADMGGKAASENPSAALNVWSSASGKSAVPTMRTLVISGRAWSPVQGQTATWITSPMPTCAESATLETMRTWWDADQMRPPSPRTPRSTPLRACCSGTSPTSVRLRSCRRDQWPTDLG